MEVVIGLIIGIIIGAVISGAVLWIVSKLGLGLNVAGFGSAMIAGLLIGFLSNLAVAALPGDGVIGAIIHLVVAAAVIFVCGKVLKGLSVEGFSGALIAAVAIALINYLIVFAFGGMA